MSDPAPRRRLRFRFSLLALIVAVNLIGLGIGLWRYRAYVLRKRDHELGRITEGRRCFQVYRQLSVMMHSYCMENGTERGPETLRELQDWCVSNLNRDQSQPLPKPLWHCPLGRKHGRIGHFVYLGGETDWSGRFYGWSKKYEGKVPVIFDYPDNHTEHESGGYVLFSDGTTVIFNKSDWLEFLDKHLPPDYALKNNDLRWYEWEPSLPE